MRGFKIFNPWKVKQKTAESSAAQGASQQAQEHSESRPRRRRKRQTRLQKEEQEQRRKKPRPNQSVGARRNDAERHQFTRRGRRLLEFAYARNDAHSFGRNHPRFQKSFGHHSTKDLRRTSKGLGFQHVRITKRIHNFIHIPIFLTDLQKITEFGENLGRSVNQLPTGPTSSSDSNPYCASRLVQSSKPGAKRQFSFMPIIFGCRRVKSKQTALDQTLKVAFYCTLT